MRDILVGMFAIAYGYFLYRKYPEVYSELSRSYRSYRVTGKLAALTLFAVWILGLALLWSVLFVFNLTLVFVVIKLVG